MKKSTSSFILCSLLIVLFSIRSHANLPKRIGSLPKDTKNVQKVYLTGGLASVFLMPCPIEEVVLGKEKDFQVSLSDKDSKILNLAILNSFTKPTNLIIRCLNSTKFYVFDLLPHSSIHQDVVVLKRNLDIKSYQKTLIEDSNTRAQIESKALRISLKGHKRGEK